MSATSPPPQETHGRVRESSAEDFLVQIVLDVARRTGVHAVQKCRVYDAFEGASGKVVGIPFVRRAIRGAGDFVLVSTFTLLRHQAVRFHALAANGKGVFGKDAEGIDVSLKEFDDGRNAARPNGGEEFLSKRRVQRDDGGVERIKDVLMDDVVRRFVVFAAADVKGRQRREENLLARDPGVSHSKSSC